MVKLTDVKGIGPAALKVLAEHKIKTVEALAAISLAELQKIPGFKGDLRARAVKQSAADCLRGKIDKPTSATSATSSNAQTTAKKTVTPKIAISPVVNQLEAGKVKDKSKKKIQEDDKKKVKDKDKEKKKKNKDKKKSGKKKDKKKS